MITLLHRPYVFAFLIAFLVIAGRHLGLRRTFLWLVSGFAIACASEASSIRNGFPYGMYHYIYENLQGEWLLFGVPVWDSLSYPFLIYAGYAMAGVIARSAATKQSPEARWEIAAPASRRARNDMGIALLGALFTMILDIIIDPLTVLGDRWFLGRVYYYPHGGPYFGVPLINFAGWFLVPFVVIVVNQWCWQLRPSSLVPRPSVLGPLFYLAIACFNIAITFWIGAWPIGLASIGWVLGILSLLWIVHRWRKPPTLP